MNRLKTQFSRLQQFAGQWRARLPALVLRLKQSLLWLLPQLRQISQRSASLLRLVFGEWQWQAPGWMLRIERWIRDGLSRFMVLLRANPGQSLSLLLLLMGLAGGGRAAWLWYEGRPKPVEFDYSLSEPGITCYACEPQGAPEPLTVHFEGSVAALDAVGKTVDPVAAGVGLSPKLAGAWTWNDDHTLRFQPQEDWPIAQKFSLSFAERGFVAAHIRLAKYAVEFTTPPFAAKIDGTEFYQDPVNAGEKKVVVTASFSHPVEPAEFEQRVSMLLHDKISDGREQEVKPAPKFSVTYDKPRLHAYIHSESLAVPVKEGRAEVKVSEGVRAARGGNTTTEPMTSNTVVPGLDSLRVRGIRLDIARDEKDDPSQILLLTTTYSVMEKNIAGKTQAWLLPEKNPDDKRQAEWEKYNAGKPYRWGSTSQVTPAVLKVAQKLELPYIANEQEHVQDHSFRYQAEPGRNIYVKVDKGLRSFGGYLMAAETDQLLTVPEFPKELHITHQGSLLAMSGSKKLTVFTRDVPAIRLEIGRLLPKQLQHLMSQTQGSSYSKPRFSHYGFDSSNITERYTRVVKLPKLKPGEAHYEPLDLNEYLSKEGGDRRGIFLVKVQVYDLENERVIEDSERNEEECEGDYCGGWGQASDSRMVVVTDIGLIVKKAADGSQDIYAQSIASGDPLPGVTVEVMARNGEAVQTQLTDDAGHARFTELKSYKHERRPVLYLARRDGDSSFMPLDGRTQRLDLSRFDVGGVSGRSEPGKLSAYLFSDRGIYRPGDEIHAGLVVKSLDWKGSLKGVPLVADITDPRGQRVMSENIALSAAGFEEIRYQTRDAAPTGNYTVNVYIPKDEHRRDLIGTMQVRLQEFLPDRLKMTAKLSAESAQGWVSPEALKASITLQNLFGTAAEKRRVTASMTLTPSFPAFANYQGYEFRDPQAATEGFNDELAETQTDAKGQAEFDLNLQRFARATYRLHLVAQGFEAEGGRGVAAETAQLVSNLPYLVGYKSDGDLGYIRRGVERTVEFIAIDPQARKTAVQGLSLQRVERKYVSVLMKQDNGTYKYQSRLKEVKLDENPLELPAKGAKLILDTKLPGRFFYALVDKDGQQFARVDYNVAGEANLTRSLEKNAELQIVLSKQDYASGEDIEMQLTAPYVGAGLITIERDRVYAQRWFKTTTTSSLQKIRMPEGVEGDAYVSVSFVRDPGSEEIYTSPLSYGVQPISVALDRRRNPVMLKTPALVKPGETLKLAYSTQRPARIVLYAVDEGILQVANYRTPDPLKHFFSKHALEVETLQILDLILPEFARMQMSAAPGGDTESAIGRNLNPFKRKLAKPVAWWSGIVESGPQSRELSYRVPDTFNGTLRVMAVAVDADAIGIAENKTLVRGDFVLSPNAPTTVTPGDEFEVSVGVSNNVIGSGENAQVTVSLEPSRHLEVLGAKQQVLKITELREAAARFKVRARDELGSGSLRFGASLPGKSAALEATLSVRPATPYMTQLSAGLISKGARGAVEVPVRNLYPQYRELNASVSVLPLSLAHGLSAYLGRYPYVCTEQLSSMAMPAVVLSSRPEFGKLKDETGKGIAGLVEELRLRQNADGAYRYWPGGTEVVEFVSLYAQHILLEASERGLGVPKDLLDSGNDYLRAVAQRDGNNLADERNSAYAIYLLTRQANVMASEAAALHKRLDERYPKDWRGDITAGHLAAAYQLMKQQSLADKAIANIKLGVERPYDRWHGGMTSDAELLYLLARHFPERLKRLPTDFLDVLVQRVQSGEYHSLSAATTILALDQYAKVMAGHGGKLAVAEIARDGQLMRSLPLPAGLFPKVEFSPEAAKLRVSTEADAHAYYLVNQSGFDRMPPTAEIKSGFEILREYTDKDGKPVSSVKMGEELDVHVKFRTINRDNINDAALVDLLPGGFELVIPPPPAPEQARIAANSGEEGEGESEYEGESDYSSNSDVAWSACGFCVGASGYLSYAEAREDRVVFYSAISADVQEYVYRVRATNAGNYMVPPAYGESMYDRKLQARSVASKITVER